MEKQLRKRTTLLSALTRLQDTCKGLTQETVSPSVIQAYLEELATISTNFIAIQEKLEDESAEAAYPVHTEERGKFEVLQRQVKIKLLTLQDGLPKPEPATVPIVTNVQGQYRLTPLKPPTFNGNYSEWRTFEDLFNTMIHNNPNLQDAQRLQYLKEGLLGEAKGTLSALPVTNANYEKAWILLRERYDCPKRIIASHFKALASLHQVNDRSAPKLRRLLDSFTENVRALESLKANTWEHAMVHLLSEKLDPETRRAWEVSSIAADKDAEGDSQKPVDKLRTYINNQCQALEAATEGHPRAYEKPSKPSHPIRSHHAASSTCPVCQESHTIYRCESFRQMDTSERIKAVQESSLCYNCLSPSHSALQCPSSNCRTCNKKHHTMLHRDFKPRDSRPQFAANKDSRPQFATKDSRPQFATKDSKQLNANLNPNAPVFNTLCNLALPLTLLPTASILVNQDHTPLAQVRTFLDLGSQVNFVSERLVHRMQLRRLPCDSPILGVGLSNSGSAKGFVQLNIRSQTSGYNRQIVALVIPRITGLLPPLPLSPQSYKHITQGPLADPYFHIPGNVDLLLGVHVCMEVIIPSDIEVPSEGRNSNKLLTLNTSFGWIVAGECCEMQQPPQPYQVHLATTELQEQIQSFWKIEEVDSAQTPSSNKEICEKHFLDTYRRDQHGRYIVELPLLSNKSLGDSRKQAIVRQLHLERRLNRDPELKQQYVQFMREYQELGHMKPIGQATSSQAGAAAYYLPHHPVLKPSSSSTKLRVVFDASAKTSTGKSLNDIMMVGPPIQEDLRTILLRFRTHKIALTADVEKMYRQIKLAEQHQPYQRIVWREDPSSPLQEFQLITVTYGTASAPYLATRTLQQIAKDHRHAFPEAADIVMTDFYVDDCLTGTDTEEDAIRLQQELIKILEMGGLSLRKWASNAPILPQDQPQLNLPLNPESQVSTLGLNWSPSQDTFTFTAVIPDQPETTKRLMLSSIARIFDPLGLISPVIIPAKIMLQQLWTLGCDWDEILPQDIQTQWSSIRTSLQQTTAIQVPRFVGTTGNDYKAHLHGFCDASEKAYGAVIYIRIEHPDGTITSSLLCSKTRVAPLKPISIPRLELCGAVLLAKLMERTRSDLKIKVEEEHCWTDSTVALAWIRGHPRRWKTFIANRVTEIQDITPPKNWHHVKGIDNPADLASRGTTSSDLKTNSLWWDGPSWLRQPSLIIPLPFTLPDPPEARIICSHHVSLPIDASWMTNYSTLKRLVRVTSYVLRFIKGCRRSKRPKTTQIDAMEFEETQQTLVRAVQRAHFTAELNTLQALEPLESKNPLSKLAPFLDAQGMIRVGGRLRNSDLDYAAKHPLLLPTKDHLSKLIVQAEHVRSLHAYPTLLIATIQQKFWIPRLKNLVRTCIRNCVICVRSSARTQQQLMGDLPSPRVTTPERAFLHTGIDYAGPIVLKQRNGRGRPTITKGYIALFVCLATKAIHLDAVTSISTEAFINTLQRFIARRGLPSDIYSDCGTNFVGAKPYLQGPFEPPFDELAELRIQWHFNPPSSPHFGGLWEAGVKSVKLHLNRVIGTKVLTYEDLSTVLTRIEACLNSRPLCPMPDDPSDLQPLTPSHFLIGSPLTSLPERNLLTIPEARLQHWEKLQQMVQHFWVRWSSEYLSRLQNRPKWKVPSENIKINDLVLIKDNTIKGTTRWPMARVIKTHPGADGLVRTVTLRTATNELKRPIHKLCLLPVDGEAISLHIMLKTTLQRPGECSEPVPNNL